MELGNFQEPIFLSFFFILLGVLMILLFLSIVFAIESKRERDFVKQVSYESSSTYVYVIDVKQNKLLSFNKSDMKKKTTSDLISFYSKFHPNDMERVKSWIFSIFTDYKNTEQYLEADVLINNGKKPCFSLLFS